MKRIFPVILVFFGATSAFGWGDTGHRVVGRIAENHLTATTKKAVQKILGKETLARMATMADEWRSDDAYRAITPLHFVEIPVGKKYGDVPVAADGDIVVGINNALSALKNRATPLEEKQKQLRLLVHFLGDLHMPLHVGNGVDRGANWCMVKFFGKINNLHSVWDSGMIDGIGLSYTEYSDFLDIAPKSEVTAIQSTKLMDWVDESATIRETVYPASEPERAYCKRAATDVIDEVVMPNLSYKYQYDFRKTIDKQLLRGGLRLAKLLNETFD